MSTTAHTTDTTAPVTNDVIPAEDVNVAPKPEPKTFPQRVEDMLDYYIAQGPRKPLQKHIKLLRDARDLANKAGEAYTNRFGNAGFSWLNRVGKYTCTFNKQDNVLYTQFTSWDELKRRKAAREDAARGEFV